MAQSRKKTILEGVQRRRRQRAIISAVVTIILIAIVVVGVYALFGPKSEYRQTIPNNVGLSSSCTRPLHTHDDTGTIHVETNQNVNYTIGDFFLIWGKVFNSSGIFPDTQPLPSYLNVCVPSNATLLYHSHPTLTIIYNTKAPSTITMTVNGNPSTEMQNFPLPRDSSANPASIVITYGPGVPASF